MKIHHKFGVLNHSGQPNDVDDFIAAAAADTLLEKRPQFSAIRFIELRKTREQYGVRSQMAFDALQRIDARIGKIRRAMPDANIIVVGDGRQQNVDKMIHLNNIFLQADWLKVRTNGQISRNWKVLAKSAGGASYIYLRDSSFVKAVRQHLQNIPGIRNIFEHDELVMLGADVSAVFMVEAANGYYFNDRIANELVEVVETASARAITLTQHRRAIGGYLPDNGKTETTLIAAGPDIMVAEKLVLEDIDMTSVAPTIAHLLDLWFDTEIVGKTIRHILIN